MASMVDVGAALTARLCKRGEGAESLRGAETDSGRSVNLGPRQKAPK